MRAEAKEKPINAVVAAVQLPNVNDIEFEASLAELRDLAKTLGFVIVATFTQKRSSFDSTAYLGAGKREEIREFIDMEPAPGAFEPIRSPPPKTARSSKSSRRRGSKCCS